MSDQKQIVRDYAAAFATCDVSKVVSYVSDDLVWEFNGVEAGHGRSAFEAQMTKDLGAGRAEVTIDNLVEENDTVVAVNRGRFVPHTGGDGLSFASAEVYTFVGNEIARIQTYQSV